MKKILVPLAEGAEEMETTIIVDVLRRAKWSVTLAGLQPGLVTCSRGIRIQPDTGWDACDPRDFDGIVLPGGLGGAQRLETDERVLAAIRDFVEEGKLVAALCAAPRVLVAAGVLAGRRATLYPGLEVEGAGVDWRGDTVVTDGMIVTSRGPGTAMAFALALIGLLESDEQANEIRKGLLLP